MTAQFVSHRALAPPENSAPDSTCSSAKKAQEFLASSVVTLGEIQQYSQGSPRASLEILVSFRTFFT
jgi:hypothetical protein